MVASTNFTRILVIAHGSVAAERAIEGVKTRRTKQGGMSQARYQRHIENYHQQHIKEVIDALDKLVMAETLDHLVISGDAVVLPLLRDQMPKHLADKIVDELSVSADANRRELIEATLEAMRKYDERTDREKVDGAVGAYRAGGLGVVRPEETLRALANGQVDELLIAASPSGPDDDNELVRKAHQMAARICFIEDPSLLAPYGGVAATLRYRV